MKKANISTVKAELSAFIKMVKRGEDVIILDRDLPVAMLTQVKQGNDFQLHEAVRDTANFFKTLKAAGPKGHVEKADILQFLADERDDRF